MPIVIGALIVIGGIIFAVMPKNKNNKDNTKKGKTHQIIFTFADNEYSPDIEEGKSKDLLFCDGAFLKEMVVKDEENPENPIPEDAKSVFEISYSVDDDSFIFQLNEASMATDDLRDFEPMSNNRYRIKNNTPASCSINFNGTDYYLDIGE